MINQGVMLGNGLAKIVQEEWERTAVFRPGVRLDAFIVMPDHIHGLITILADGGGLTNKYTQSSGRQGCGRFGKVKD